MAAEQLLQQLGDSAMQRRVLASACSAVAVATLLASVSPVLSATAQADEMKRDDYKKLVLYDVKGDAKIVKKYGYIYKVEDYLEFKNGVIYIKKLKCYYGYCDIKGIISGSIFDKYYKLKAVLYYEDFKAKAILYKKDDYPDYPTTASYVPPPKDDKCDLEIDIGVIKVVQYDKYDKYKKFPKIIFIDPDKQDLYVKDSYLKKYLCEQAKHYDYDTPGAEEAS
jgi:hypothetical protein